MTLPADLTTSYAAGQRILASSINADNAKVNTLIDHVRDETAPLGLAEITASTYSDPVDLAGKSHVAITLDASIGSLEFVWPTMATVEVAITQDATGGRTIAFDGVTWQGGDTPIIDSTASSTTTVTLSTMNGGATIRGYHGQPQVEYHWSTANGVDIATATNIPEYPVFGPIRILYVVGLCKVAPVGATTMKVDVNWNGSTIYSTQANRPTWASGATQSSVTLPDTTLLVPSGGTPGRLGIDIDAVGNTTAGQGMVFTIRALAVN